MSNPPLVRPIPTVPQGPIQMPQQQQQPHNYPQQNQNSYSMQNNYPQMSQPMANPSAYQQQQYNPHVHQNPQNPQSTQFNAGSNVFGFMSDPTTQLGMQFGSKAFAQGTEYVNQNLNRYVNVPHLKYYFNVSNSYVLNKIKLILFPFRNKIWSRSARRTDPSGQVVEYRPPRDDLLAPDMYIPVMAFVTYVLLVGINFGKEQKFHPQILGMTSSKCLVLLFLEVLCIKLGCYLFSVTTEVPLLDLVAYSGYKFVGIIVTAIAQLFSPDWITWTVLFYTSAAIGFFLLRSLKYIVLPEHNTSTVHLPARRRRIQFLFIIAAIQVFTSWFLKTPASH